MQTANGLHHRINGRIADDVHIMVYRLHAGQIDLLQAQNLGNFHILTGGNDVVDTLAHHAKTEQSDLHNFPPAHKWKTLAFS